jgi:hypothetical protein
MNIQVREEEEGSLGFSLLDFVYGFAVFVCIFLVPVIFSAAYRPEIKKGTIRTLVCYPVSPLDITVTKLLYALIIGFIFAYLTFMIPSQGIDKPAGDYLRIFLMAFTLTFVTMVIGALAALSLAKLTGRMWIKPASWEASARSWAQSPAWTATPWSTPSLPSSGSRPTTSGESSSGPPWGEAPT